jgi:hypothetical protein
MTSRRVVLALAMWGLVVSACSVASAQGDALIGPLHWISNWFYLRSIAAQFPQLPHRTSLLFTTAGARAQHDLPERRQGPSSAATLR